MSKLYDPVSPVQWSWITLSGVDARDFLHRLTTIDLRNLATDRGAPGFFLTAQGRIRAWFRLWRVGESAYGFEFDAGADLKWRKQLLEFIDQYTFAEKIAIASDEKLRTRWIFPDDDSETVFAALGVEALTAGQTRETPSGIRVCHQGARDFGRDWLTLWGTAEALEATGIAGERVSFEDTERWRVLALRPRVDLELDENTVPLELGLEDGLAEFKGCYPGQEVIERIRSQGNPPRRLVLIEGAFPMPATGDPIRNETGTELGKLGTVVSLDSPAKGFAALALLRKAQAQTGVKIVVSARPACTASITRLTSHE